MLPRGAAAGLGLLLIVLTSIVAVASRSAPFSRSESSASAHLPSVTVGDALIAVGLIAVCGISLLLAYSPRPRWRRPGDDEPELVDERPPTHWATKLVLALLPALLFGGLVATLAILRQRGSEPQAQQPTLVPPGASPPNPMAKAGATPNPPGPGWLVIGACAGVALLTVALTTIWWRRERPRPTTKSARAAAMVSVLDQTLDDLRADSDPRRAVIAAYARMETALASAGLARRASEAPFEYLRRILEELQASSAASRRLTELFERAKFSRHRIERSMQDDAISAVAAIRDELRTEG